MEPLRISAVSYLNTFPFVYGLKQSGLLTNFDLSLDVPSMCAEKLKNGQADIALVPVGALPEIDRFLRRRLGPLYHREHLVMDLSATTFVDSSFVAFVVRLLKELRAWRKELVLVRPGGQVRRVLALVGLPNLVPVFDSLDEAMGALAVGRLPLIPPAFDAARR